MKQLLIIGGSDAGVSGAPGYTPPLSSPWDPVQTSCMEWAETRSEGAA